MDFSVMDNIKAKKDPSQKDKSIFSIEINKLLKETGITQEIVPYLSYAVKCNAIKTIIQWNTVFSDDEQIQNMKKIIDLISNSSMSAGERFRIYMSFLVSYFNISKENTELTKIILLNVVDTSYNKEHKRLGDIGKTFKTSFVENMNESITLPNLYKMGFENYNYYCSLVELFNELISDLDNTITTKATDKDKNSKYKLKEWIKNQQAIISSKETSANERKELSESQNNNNTETSSLANKDISPSDSSSLSKPQEEKTFKNLYAKQIYDLAVKIEDSEDEKKHIESELRKSRSELANIRNEIDDLKKKYSNKCTECVNKEKRIAELESKVSEMNARIKEMSEKIARQADTMGTIKDSQGRETSEKLNSIASSLKRFYDDFQSSVDMEMTIDLGENMRDMVEDIFKKLEKCGIDIKGR